MRCLRSWLAAALLLLPLAAQGETPPKSWVDKDTGHRVYRSPDEKLIFFTSNMFGPSYVFAVEVAKSIDPPPADVLSTPVLAERFTPKPSPTPFSEQW
jgi:hypothetical protein